MMCVMRPFCRTRALQGHERQHTCAHSQRVITSALCCSAWSWSCSTWATRSDPAIRLQQARLSFSVRRQLCSACLRLLAFCKRCASSWAPPLRRCALCRHTPGLPCGSCSNATTRTLQRYVTAGSRTARHRFETASQRLYKGLQAPNGLKLCVCWPTPQPTTRQISHRGGSGFRRQAACMAQQLVAAIGSPGKAICRHCQGQVWRLRDLRTAGCHATTSALASHHTNQSFASLSRNVRAVLIWSRHRCRCDRVKDTNLLDGLLAHPAQPGPSAPEYRIHPSYWGLDALCAVPEVTIWIAATNPVGPQRSAPYTESAPEVSRAHGTAARSRVRLGTYLSTRQWRGWPTGAIGVRVERHQTYLCCAMRVLR